MDYECYLRLPFSDEYSPARGFALNAHNDQQYPPKSGNEAHMEKVSDTITSVFHIAIKDKRPVICSSGDGVTIWSETFGLGWRFGIAYNSQAWFPKVRLYLDHTQTQAEQDQAVVTVSLRDTADKDPKEITKRETIITDFGHGRHALLGSWSPSDLALHPYVSLTLTTMARLPQPITNPLYSASQGLRQSLDSGEFVDTKFYVFSAKRHGSTAGKPRVVYANSNSIGFALPNSTLRGKQINLNGSAPAFLVSMTSDNHINDDSVLHEYEYEQDSDLDDNDDDDNDSDDSTARHQRHPVPSRFRAGPSSKAHTPMGSKDGSIHGDAGDEFLAEPPAYSVSNCRMILVKGVAYKTWLAYTYFRYTGQVSFRPLKSARGSPSATANRRNWLPSCSPKSMYRLAAHLGNEGLKEIARRAIQEGLSKDNIVEEAFTWFTAQYPTIFEYEVEKVSELRKLPEVSSALRLQLKAVSLGEKPWAQHVLIAIMDKLNSSEPST